MITAGPALRWAGGKRALLGLLAAAMPADFVLGTHRLYEPFIGGGALTFSLATNADGTPAKIVGGGKAKPLIINDANAELTCTYRVIRDDVDSLIKALTLLQADTSEARYYQVRAQTPSADIDRAARFIYLNKLSFNGLWRVNSAGAYNVPYGKLAKPVVCDEALLRADSAWLAHADIRTGSYINAISDARAGDVVYFDPPYIPLSATASFSKYAKDDFTILDQWGLAGVVAGLTNRGVRVILSNSDTPASRQIFSPVLSLRTLSVTRSISAAASSRVKAGELLGLNYPVTKVCDPARLGAMPVVTTTAPPASL